jgi:hypothetical protein
VRRVYADLREDDCDTYDALRREHGEPVTISTSVTDSVVQGIGGEKSAFVSAWAGVAGREGRAERDAGDTTCEDGRRVLVKSVSRWKGGEQKKTHLVRISKSVPTKPRRH